MTSKAEMSDREVLDAYPDWPIDRDSIGHYRGLLERRLLINRCSGCGYWVYPHRPLCPRCLSWDVVPTEVSGRGHVYMFTLIQQERDPDSVLREPAVTAAVELEEQAGLRYLAPVVHCPADRIVLDMPVRLTWVERDSRMAPAFEPVQE